jgi:hypothetical protein
VASQRRDDTVYPSAASPTLPGAETNVTPRAAARPAILALKSAARVPNAGRRGTPTTKRDAASIRSVANASRSSIRAAARAGLELPAIPSSSAEPSMSTSARGLSTDAMIGRAAEATRSSSPSTRTDAVGNHSGHSPCRLRPSPMKTRSPGAGGKRLDCSRAPGLILFSVV